MIETESAAWIANSGDGTVTRLDRKTGDVLGTTKVGRNPRQLAFGNGFVWVTNNDDNTVTRLDPNTGRVVGSPIPVGQKPLGIAVRRRRRLGRQPRRPHDHPDRSLMDTTGFFQYPGTDAAAHREPARVPRGPR